MTYLEYIDQLLNEMQVKRAFAFGLYETLASSKGSLNTAETKAHLARISDCHALADQAESILLSLLNGSLSPLDTID